MNVKKQLRKALSILLLLGTVMGSFTSCEETAVVNEFANWKVRNAEFIDSIAAVAEANADGKWLRMLSFKLNETNIDGDSIEYDTEDYIYCHIEAEGTGTESPVFSDTVLVNYRGRLIPTLSYPEGKVFDESYKGALNPAVNVPTKFSVGGVVVGWSTALQRMKAGDIWRVYIPAELGYGSREQTDIPAYSALIFDMNLVNLYHIGTPVPKQ